MTTTAMNLRLYRVLKSLNVPDAEAQAAAETAPPDPGCTTSRDLSHLATKGDLSRLAAKEEVRAEVAVVRTEIAQAAQRQTTWLLTALVAAVGLLLAVQSLMPQSLPSDAVRAVVAQTVRDMQAGPVPPR